MLAISQSLLSQDWSEIGYPVVSDTIKSEILKEDRPIQVFLPESYEDTIYTQHRYPVIYFMDSGSPHQKMFVHIAKFLEMERQIPEAIIIVIESIDYIKDNTPTYTISDGLRTDSLTYGSSGHQDNYLKFLNMELKKKVTKDYRTNGYNMLAGHSLGGLTVLSEFIFEGQQFDSYLALDPGLWWDNAVIIDLASDAKVNILKNKKRIFLAEADPKNSETIGFLKESFHEPNRKIREIINNQYAGKVEFKKVRYENSQHFYPLLEGALDGFKFIFENFYIDITIILDNPEVYVSNLERFSKATGKKFAPRESHLDLAGTILMAYGKNEQVIRIYKMNADLFPKSWHVWSQLGIVYEQTGQNSEAIAAYKKSLSLKDNLELKIKLQELTK